MPSLSKVDARFLTTLRVLEGGKGSFKAVINEPSQGEAPSYQFNLPRRLMRVGSQVPVKVGMVIQDQSGTVFMVGKHGNSESRDQTLFRNFRLFEATARFPWMRRGKIIEPVTGLEQDSGLVAQPPIWGCYEPGTQEAFDRQLRSNFETGRFITPVAVGLDDMIDDRKVTRIDQQLGLYVVSLG